MTATATSNGNQRTDRLAAMLSAAAPTLVPTQVPRTRRPLRTHAPSCAVSWPLILLEGGEKSAKSWMAAELTGSPRVGRSFWIQTDVSELTAEEYGAVPGARYEIVDLDGSWVDLVDQIDNIRDIAEAELAAGRPPVALIIDSMTHLWRILSEWAQIRAANSDEKKRKLALDPDAEITISPDKWTAANKRHRKLMTRLMTFPGIVIVTARGKETVEIDAKGEPTGNRVYKVEAQRDLAFDASVWIRLDRVKPPTIIGCRSVHIGMVPGKDGPREIPGLKLDALIFDTLKCGKVPTAPRQGRDLAADLGDGGELPESIAAQVAALAAETATDAALAAVEASDAA